MVETPEDCANMEAFVAWMGETDPDEIEGISAGRLPGLLAVTWQQAWAASRDYERQQSDEYQRGYAEGYEAGEENGKEAGAEAALKEDEGVREALTAALQMLVRFCEVHEHEAILLGIPSWYVAMVPNPIEAARATLAAAAEGATVERATEGEHGR